MKREASPGSACESIAAKLRRGEIVASAGKLFVVCRKCGSVVRINKPLLGALHLCDYPEREH